MTKTKKKPTTLNEIILLTYRSSVALHRVPSPPDRAVEVGEWRKDEAALHRLCADLIEGMDGIAAVPYMENNQRIVIELSDGETLDDLVAQLMSVLDAIDCCPYPGEFHDGRVIIDRDFIAEMNA